MQGFGAAIRLEEGDVAFEGVLGNFGPKPPDEEIGAAMHGNHDAAPNKESLVGEHAGLGRHVPAPAAAWRHVEKRTGFLEPDVQRQSLVRFAAFLADVCHGSGFRQIPAEPEHFFQRSTQLL